MLRAKQGMRLVMALHEAAGEGDTTAVLATALAKIAVARTDGRGLGKAVDEVLAGVLERLVGVDVEPTVSESDEG
jgi:hypothetical protein